MSSHKGTAVLTCLFKKKVCTPKMSPRLMLKNSKIQVSRILSLIHTSVHESIISISVTRKQERKKQGSVSLTLVLRKPYSLSYNHKL